MGHPKERVAWRFVTVNRFVLKCDFMKFDLFGAHFLDSVSVKSISFFSPRLSTFGTRYFVSANFKQFLDECF